MANVFSGPSSTTVVLDMAQSEALEIILGDWRNIMSEAIRNGEDPHGHTRQTWDTIREIAEALGVERDLDIDDECDECGQQHDPDNDHICWTDDTLCPECGSNNN